MNPWRAVGWVVLVLLLVAVVLLAAGIIQPTLFGFEPRK